jgi:hypothetical protein
MTSDLERVPTENEQPKQEPPEGEDRWSAILADVHEKHRSTQPWYLRLGITLAWSAGIGISMGLITLLLLVIANLFTKEKVLTARNASDWIFWASALLLFSGLLAPTSSGEEENSSSPRQGSTKRPAITQRAASGQGSNSEGKPVRTFEERQARSMRKRLMQVYNPWRWRLWLSSVFCFSLSVLMGVLS